MLWIMDIVGQNKHLPATNSLWIQMGTIMTYELNITETLITSQDYLSSQWPSAITNSRRRIISVLRLQWMGLLCCTKGFVLLLTGNVRSANIKTKSASMWIVKHKEIYQKQTVNHNYDCYSSCAKVCERYNKNSLRFHKTSEIGENKANGCEIAHINMYKELCAAPWLLAVGCWLCLATI